ncbi:hypothetical protein GGQ85_002657 [Nitrobacter vulgaris]|nr:hypothetical protein [Nitrobacter vulgaris]
MARINFYRAVYGDTPPPIGNPEEPQLGEEKTGEGSVICRPQES